MKPDKKSIEAKCPACGRETLLLRKPLYEGFTRVGEELSCSLCGHRFADEESPEYIERSGPAVFSEADRPAEVKVFSEEDQPSFCRHCGHYVVNPFRQWCSRHKKEVEATDTCRDFFRRAEKEES
ncbi:MAG: hypothetical protein AB7T27_11670 [Kiritimatiellia bacterium]